MADIRETTEKAGQTVKESAEKAREATARRLEELRGDLGEYYEEGLARARLAEAQFEDAVRGNPVRSVLISAGIGIGVGILIASLLRR